MKGNRISSISKAIAKIYIWPTILQTIYSAITSKASLSQNISNIVLQSLGSSEGVIVNKKAKGYQHEGFPSGPPPQY